MLEMATKRASQWHLLWIVNRGKAADTVYLKMPFAAIALAPNRDPYVWIIYCVVPICAIG